MVPALGILFGAGVPFPAISHIKGRPLNHFVAVHRYDHRPSLVKVHNIGREGGKSRTA